MGGYDVYCAICGGPFGNILEDSPQDLYDEGEMNDRDLAGPEQGAWLERCRVIGENTESVSMDKVFISGPAREEDAAFFAFDAGDDPNLPEDLNSVQTYNIETGEPLAIPFHDDCLDLLRAKIGAEAFRKDVLYHTLAHHAQNEYGRCLNIDWGALGERQDQYFWLQKGDEEYVLCPTNIPRLREYYDALPRIYDAQADDAKGMKKRRPSASTDVFSVLPPELLHLVIEQLSIQDTFYLRAASSAVCDLELANSFWRGRTSRDMPWLYDIPAGAATDETIDWFTLYRDLFAASRRGSAECMLPLVNRRRVWTAMDQITGTYLDEYDRVSAQKSPILEDVQAGYMPVLIDSDSERTDRSVSELLTDFEDIAHVQSRISVHWTKDGALANLSVSASSTADGSDVPSRAHRRDELIVPLDDWVKEVTVYSRSKPDTESRRPGRRRRNGVQQCVGIEFTFAVRDSLSFGETNTFRRVFRPMPGQVVVGLMTDCTSNDNRLSKLALLQQPRDRFPADCPRITHATGANRDMGTEKLLWRRSLPDPRTKVVDYVNGYWGADGKVDTLPMEHLVFAETDAEWASMTRISGDMNMGGFKVDYSDRESRTVGPRLGPMRSMTIDGAGGERITCVVAFVGHIVSGLRFVTNRDRVLQIGLDARGTRANRFTASSELRGKELVGMYCSWLDTAVISRLETFGALSRDSLDSYDNLMDPQEALDERDFVWDPLPPPDNTMPVGRLWGEWTRERPPTMRCHCPDSGTIVSWLDFSRQVRAVELISSHAASKTSLNVCGIALEYADGASARAAIGYTSLPPSGDFADWCQCSYGVNLRQFEKESPHFWSTRWNPGGGRIMSLKAHLDPNGALCGVQFVDGSGEGSPLWGVRPEDGSVGEITFVDETIGAKFFMNSNKRSTTYDDVVVVALQALARRS